MGTINGFPQFVDCNILFDCAKFRLIQMSNYKGFDGKIMSFLLKENMPKIIIIRMFGLFQLYEMHMFNYNDYSEMHMLNYNDYFNI